MNDELIGYVGIIKRNTKHERYFTTGICDTKDEVTYIFKDNMKAYLGKHELKDFSFYIVPVMTYHEFRVEKIIDYDITAVDWRYW